MSAFLPELHLGNQRLPAAHKTSLSFCLHIAPLFDHAPPGRNFLQHYRSAISKDFFAMRVRSPAAP